MSIHTCEDTGPQWETFTTDEAVALYKSILYPGVGITTDSYGDGFIATIWDTDIRCWDMTPIGAVKKAIRKRQVQP